MSWWRYVRHCFAFASALASASALGLQSVIHSRFWQALRLLVRCFCLPPPRRSSGCEYHEYEDTVRSGRGGAAEYSPTVCTLR
eukprot:COSAG01_NODE_52870_length_343_cov_1.053279_1_plen_82_part_01